MVNIVGFVGHTGLVMTIQLIHQHEWEGLCSNKALFMDTEV